MRTIRGKISKSFLTIWGFWTKVPIIGRPTSKRMCFRCRTWRLCQLEQFAHGVNLGQGEGGERTNPPFEVRRMLIEQCCFPAALKSGAMIRRFTHNDALLESTRNGVNWTFLYHGNPSGAIIGDERISGLSPMRGKICVSTSKCKVCCRILIDS